MINSHLNSPSFFLTLLILMFISGSVSAGHCSDAVQNKIAWDYKGSKKWGQRNLERLCRGVEDSSAPAECFKRVMFGKTNWGGGSKWKWHNALDLCEGSQNARATIYCFKEKIDAGIKWHQAIPACDERNLQINQKTATRTGEIKEPSSPIVDSTQTKRTTNKHPVKGPIVAKEYGEYCAGERGLCRFSGSADVYYGIGNRWVRRQLTGPVVCNNDTFGDPAFGKAKKCYTTSGHVYKPTIQKDSASAPENKKQGDVPVRMFSTTQVAPKGKNLISAYRDAGLIESKPKGIKCADEHKKCHFIGAGTLYYGSGDTWYTLPAYSGPIRCNNSTFNFDPARGVKKSCYIDTPDIFSLPELDLKGMSQRATNRLVNWVVEETFRQDQSVCWKRTYAPKNSCSSDYYFVTPLCWQSCSDQHQVDCGAMCGTSAGSCVSASFNMALSTGTFLSNFTGAALAGKSVKTGVKLAKTAAKTNKKLARQRLVAALTRAGNKVAVKMRNQTESRIIAHVTRRTGQHSSKQMVKEYSTMVLRRAARNVVIAEASKDAALSDIISLADPTGIYDMVQSFNKPLCGPLPMPN